MKNERKKKGDIKWEPVNSKKNKKEILLSGSYLESNTNNEKK